VFHACDIKFAQPTKASYLLASLPASLDNTMGAFSFEYD
jgi:hypothetical protein